MTLYLKTLSSLFFRPFVAWGEGGLTPPSVVDAPEFGAELSRHDDHNLEIKTWVQTSGWHYETDVDFHLFVPSSFQLSRWQKQELAQDLRSRVRLAIPPRREELHRSQSTAEAVWDQTEILWQQWSLGNEVPLAEVCKEIGVLVSEWLKHQMVADRRQFLMAHSLSIPSAQRPRELQRLLLVIKETDQILQRLRQRSENQTPQEPTLVYLDEYLSNFYVQYLGALRRGMSELDPLAREKADSEAYRRVWDEMGRTLEAFQCREAKYRAKFPKRVELAQSKEDQEASVIRLGQLKKFFQSKMFVDVTRHSPATRFIETTAVAGTALAGICWASLQFFNRPEMVQTTHQGVFFFSFAVLAYVLRDRIKDRAKHSLHSRVKKWLPDTHHLLEAEGRPIGSIREWLNVHRSSHVSSQTQALRRTAYQADLEEHLLEDVVHLRKTFQLSAQSTSSRSGWALQENVRVNLDRYLKMMDDPLKELAVLTPTGELGHLHSRRVYHFYASIQLRARLSGPKSPVSSEAKNYFYRVVLDKGGIDRLESLL